MFLDVARSGGRVVAEGRESGGHGGGGVIGSEGVVCGIGESGCGFLDAWIGL